MKTKNIVLICLIISVLGLFYSCEKENDKENLKAEFTTESQEITAGDTLSFTDNSEGNPSKWNWTFEGGTPSTSVLSSPSIIYNSPGTYSVTLNIGRLNDSTTITKDSYITVSYGQVSADFVASDTLITQGNSITFSDLSIGIPTSWAWEFIPVDGGETITSTEQNPSITFDNFGIYTVKLTATNPQGSSVVTKENYLNILDASSVQADFTAESQGTYEGGTVSFIDASIGTATEWAWTFEGGNPETSTEQNPTVTYNTAGRYKVKLVAINNYKSSEIEIEDYVLVVPGTGLVAFYPLDGSGDDVGPNAVNTSNPASGTITFNESDRSAINKAASFDGSSILVAPNHESFNFGTGDFTISCWIKTDLTSKMMIWQESGSNGGGDNQAWLRIGDNTSDRLLRFAVEDETGGTIINSSTGVSDNDWHQVVCVRSGITSSVYIDGVLITTKDAAAPKDVSSDQDFKIGAQETSGGGSYSNYFTGLLDELIIYNRALTEIEIQSLHDQ